MTWQDRAMEGQYRLLRMKVAELLALDFSNCFVSDSALLALLEDRLLPKGVEWPRFEDGEPVKPDCDFADGAGNTRTCTSVELLRGEDGARDALIHWDEDDPDNALLVCMAEGEKVKHPAPKVLDADGVEIRVGDTVYDLGTSEPCTVTRTYKVLGGMAVKPVDGIGDEAVVSPLDFSHKCPVFAADGKPLRVGDTVRNVGGGRWFKVLAVGEQLESYPEYTVKTVGVDGMRLAGWSKPADLTHDQPAFGADGKPLIEGEMVYDKDTGDRFEVNGFSDDGFVVCWDVDKSEADVEIMPSQLTHRAPVLAADGKPLRVGDEVWDMKGYGPYEVEGVNSYGIVNIKGNPYDYFGNDFTHERPDSWERLESDCSKFCIEYCDEYGLIGDGCNAEEGDAANRHCSDCDDSCEFRMARDLVRRAKKLAGVE